MAADKSSKRKRKGSSSHDEGGFALRQPADPRTERRYEPRTSPAAALTMLGVWIGALLLGAGVFGHWLRSEELGPYPYAVYFLGSGGVLLAALALFGQWLAPPIRVGDAGVGVEKSATEIERIAWHDITRVLLTGDALTLQASGTSIAIPLRGHREAAARTLAEIRARIPARIDGIKENALPAPDDAKGEIRPLEPPQVAGLRCEATDKLISFERDARLCGRCGAIYHSDGVPRRCTVCDAVLRA
jgi:hypothetical protein